MKFTAPSHLTLAAILGLLAFLVIASALLALPATAQAQTTDPPAKPTGLTGSVAHNRVSLSWDNPGDTGIKSYRILRRNKDVDDPGVFHIHVGSTGSSATSYTDSDVDAETRYVYRIKARNAHGLSPRSGYFDANTPAAPEEPDTGPPAKPTGLTGDVEHNRVSLRWDDPDDSSITSHQILRRDRAVHGEGEFIVLDDDTGSARQSHVDNSVQPENQYVYRIKARNAAGLSPQSGYFNADTPPAPAPPEPETQDPPARPAGLTNAVTHDSVTLSWSDPDDGSITGYRILRLNRAEDDIGEFHVHVNNTGSAATSYTDSDVEAEQRYVYRIRALNDGGESPRSSYTNADTPAAPEEPGEETAQADDTPATPNNLFTASTHNQVVLFWQDPGDDSITGYRILRGPDPGSLTTLVEDTESASTSYTDNSVEAETTYVYALQSRNSSGESGRSETARVTTGAAPAGEEPLITAKQFADISLVSNTGESQNGTVTAGNATLQDWAFASSFHTGDHPDGYTVTSVQLRINRLNSDAIPIVSIFSDNSGSVGSSLHALTNPDTLPVHTDSTLTLTTFEAPTNTILTANTTYWLAVEADNPGTGVFYLATRTLSHKETSGDSTEWNIGNSNHRKQTDNTWSQNSNSPIQMNIQGKLINPPGVVTITPEDAQVSTELMASLTDEDGGVSNVRWQWSRSRNGETGWTNISGARTASYTPVYIDQGEYLRATASYDDDHGSGKTASGIIEGPPALALVSNTAESSGAFIDIGKIGNTKVDHANSFHTGDNPDGYALSSVQLLVNRQNEDATPLISIFSNSSGNVGTSLYTLTNPRPLPIHTDDITYELTTFTAPDDTTLTPDTTYWLVAQAADPGSGITYRVRTTGSHNEASDDSPEWEIGDVLHGSTDDAAWAETFTNSIKMNVQGKLINPPGVVTITPEDAEIGTELTASLESTHGGVTNVTWQWSRSRDGKSGWTNISGATRNTYTPIYIDQGEYLRATASYNDNHGSGKTASGIIEGPPALALVSNTAESQDTAATAGIVADITYKFATSFHTGDNPDGYEVTSVQLLINRRNSNATPEISIFSDNSGSPGASLHTLTNPSTLPLHNDTTTYELVTFTAPDDATLAADTTYWVVAQAVNPSNDVNYNANLTDSDNEASDDSPEWNIGDVLHNSSNNAAWSQTSTASIQMNVQGKLINPPGVVTITPEDAEVGTPLTASVTDPDGGVTNVTWQWRRSRDGETGWTRISGATRNTYTPIYIDQGEYLRARAFYDDNHGFDKAASGIIKGPPALALVSNTAEEQAGSLTVGVNVGEFDFNYATSFHTGDHAEGYAFTSVQLLVNRTDLEVIPIISILSDNSGTPSTSLHTLTNPRPLPLHEDAMTFELMTFAAPSNTTLPADTTYWLSVTGVDDGSLRIYQAGTTRSDNEISSDSPAWEIGDVTHQTTDGSTWTQGSEKSIQLNIQGRLINPPGVVTITPEDAEIGTKLTASLKSPHGGVTNVTWQWSRSGNGETDWTNISGQTTAGYTPIYSDQGEYLRATASYDDDDGTGKTASGIIMGPPALALVSNTGETRAGSVTAVVNLGELDFNHATSFHTGDHAEGYAFTSVELYINRTSSEVIPIISIFSDNSGTPGTSLHTLTNPSTLPIHDDTMTFELTTFTAPGNITLAADTTYWVSVTAADDGSIRTYRAGTTKSDNEISSDSPEWGIGDTTYQTTDGTTWTQSSERSIHIKVQGRLINPRGVVTFDQPRPNIDNLLTASLTDEDGGITNVRWQWSISDDGETAWTDISGANSASYTPVEADAGKYLRAVVTYRRPPRVRPEGRSRDPATSRSSHYASTLTLNPGMFAYEFHSTDYEPLGDFRFQWKSTDVTGPDNAPWPTDHQFKPTHDVENFCAMPGITRAGCHGVRLGIRLPQETASARQLADLGHQPPQPRVRLPDRRRTPRGRRAVFQQHQNAGRPRPHPQLIATERGIKAWRVDTAGHVSSSSGTWRSPATANKRFYIRSEDLQQVRLAHARP